MDNMRKFTNSTATTLGPLGEVASLKSKRLEEDNANLRLTGKWIKYFRFSLFKSFF